MDMIDLSGDWKLRPEFLDMPAERFVEVLSRPDGLLTMPLGPVMRFPSRQGYLKARVPGDVLTALTETGLIDEPLMKTNTDHCLWVKDYSWWFIRDFAVAPELLNHDVVNLLIEILDYKADILLNGIPIARHANAFRPFEADVKRYLHAGNNQLVIRLTCGLEDHYPYNSISHYFGNGILEQKIFLRKPIFGLGWDWCKPVPTCGIGRKVALEGISGARVVNWRVDTLAIRADGSAKLSLHVALENCSTVSADDAQLDYTIRFAGQAVYSGQLDLYLAAGLNYANETIDIPQVHLWWPNGYGRPDLYTIELTVHCRGAVNGQPAKAFGIRIIELDQSRRDDGTRNFRFVVNGVGVFCKGGNWVPADSIYLRIPDAKYEILVDEACEQNFTMLRIWGGGLYEPDIFYDRCSEKGILIMHDFMYACAYYPDHLDNFRHEAALEADYQTRRLASQACLAIWTGNNEIHESYTDWFKPDVQAAVLSGARIFNYILPDIVRKNCPLTPYMPSSPFYGDRANSLEYGDTHAWTFMGRDPETRLKFRFELEAFDRFGERVRFSSEFGFHGALMPSSVERYHDGEPMRFDNPIWIHHGEHPGKNLRIREAISRHLTDDAPLTETAYLQYSGLMQGALYEELALALRRQPQCSGNLIWMYNDCWPETGWTTIDYYLTRKIAFYFLKRAYAPRLLIVRVQDDQVQLTALNETPEPVSLVCRFGYMTFEGEVLESEFLDLALAPHSFNRLASRPAGRDLTHGFYFLWPQKSCGFAPATSLRAYYRQYDFVPAHLETEVHRDGPDWIMTVKTDCFVPFVWIRCDDDRTHCSDNYFPLLPGESRTVRVEQCLEQPLAEIIPVHPAAWSRLMT